MTVKKKNNNRFLNKVWICFSRDEKYFLLHHLTIITSSDLGDPGLPPFTPHCYKLEHAQMWRRPAEGLCTNRLNGGTQERSRQIKNEQTCSGDKRGGTGVEKSKYKSLMMSF